MTAKVVLTDYVWDSLDVERTTLEGLATLVPLQTKTSDQFYPEAEDRFLIVWILELKPLAPWRLPRVNDDSPALRQRGACCSTFLSSPSREDDFC